MSRQEQDMIQGKLKAAIQNHQMLVVKLKRDNQNPTFKKRLIELQDEIKRLSEEHKRLVVKVRENLVRSMSQSQAISAHQASSPLGNGPIGGPTTITAIGQPRIVSLPAAQSGAAIVPMSMVAVPIAHMQRPPGGVSLQPSGMSALSQPANISIIPTGIINNACNLNFAALNGSGGLALGGAPVGNIGPFIPNVGQNVISNGFVNPSNNTIIPASAANVSSMAAISSSGDCVSSGSNSTSLTTTVLAPSVGVISNSSINLSNLTNLTSLIINNSIGSNHPLVSNNINNKSDTKASTITTSSVTNSNSFTHNGVSAVSMNNVLNTGSMAANSSVTNSISTDSACTLATAAVAVNSSNSNQGGSFFICPVAIPPQAAVVPPSSSASVTSICPQPLVQPQLLQQQQQQIIQLIQQQQQQQPPQLLGPPPPPPPPPPSSIATTISLSQQQRLASHLPIKVPQYTASLMRPGVNTTSVQCYTIAPAPCLSGTALTSKTSIAPVTSNVKTTAFNVPPILTPLVRSAQPVLNGRHIGAAKEMKDSLGKQSPAKQAKLSHQRQLKQAKSKMSQQLKDKDHNNQPDSDPLSPKDKEKIKFMQALNLYTQDAIKDIILKRGERKRRTTANPNYSIGFEMSRKDRVSSLWSDAPVKKARGKSDSTMAGWSDCGLQSHWIANRINRQSDSHEDFCAACAKGGSLLMCSTCRLVYHLDCLNPPLTEAPKYAWSCPQCLVSGKGLLNLSSDALKNVQSFIDKKAEKEYEKKKILKRGRELKRERNFLDRRAQELNEKVKEQEDLQSTLFKEEQKLQEDLSKLSDFVNLIRESRSAEHVARAQDSPMETACS